MAVSKPLCTTRTRQIVDWSAWLRFTERKLAQLNRFPLPRHYLASLTLASFTLDGMEISEPEVAVATAHGAARRAFRSRQAQRVRNHVAILHCLESMLRKQLPLTLDATLRWYTNVSSGLCTTALSAPTLDRLDRVVRRINTPQHRLQPAMQDIARLHLEILTDPIFPSFNGILARLLLHYHLGRTGIPPLLFNAANDSRALRDRMLCLPKLMERVETTLTALAT
jgi:hypothetical protein